MGNFKQAIGQLPEGRELLLNGNVCIFRRDLTVFLYDARNGQLLMEATANNVDDIVRVEKAGRDSVVQIATPPSDPVAAVFWRRGFTGRGRTASLSELIPEGYTEVVRLDISEEPSRRYVQHTTLRSGGDLPLCIVHQSADERMAIRWRRKFEGQRGYVQSGWYASLDVTPEEAAAFLSAADGV